MCSKNLTFLSWKIELFYKIMFFCVFALPKTFVTCQIRTAIFLNTSDGCFCSYTHLTHFYRNDVTITRVPLRLILIKDIIEPSFLNKILISIKKWRLKSLVKKYFYISIIQSNNVLHENEIWYDSFKRKNWATFLLSFSFSIRKLNFLVATCIIFSRK